MEHSQVTHRCPPAGEDLTPCCGHSPLELSRSDRLTLDDALVTCQPAPAAPAAPAAPTGKHGKTA